MTRQRDEGPAIVAGIDGSTSSVEAVRRAAIMARSRGAALHIVHGYQPLSRFQVSMAQAKFDRELGYSNGARADIDGIGDNYVAATQALDDAAYLIDDPGLKIFLHAVRAEQHKALRWVAEEKRAQLIVVDNKPAKSLLHPFRKPLHELLQATTTCPVHVVDTMPWWHVSAPVRSIGEPLHAASRT